MADIPGTDASETLNGSVNDDVIDAKGGDDLIIASLGSDAIDGGLGLDTVDYSKFNASLTIVLFDNQDTAANVGPYLKDTLRNVENIIGGDQNDYLWGNSSNNTFVGAGGDDYFIASLGVDTYYGDQGFDTVDYTHLNIGVNIDRVGPNQLATIVNGVPIDRLYSVEQIYGSFQADIIKGSSAGEQFYGFGDEDQLFGRGGSDTLIGGMDDDLLSGGKGVDTFVFQGEFGNDTITDFKFRGARHDIIAFVQPDEITSFDDLIKNHATSTADGVLIDAGDQGSVLLEGVRINQLTPEQFAFLLP